MQISEDSGHPAPTRPAGRLDGRPTPDPALRFPVQKNAFSKKKTNETLAQEKDFM